MTRGSPKIKRDSTSEPNKDEPNSRMQELCPAVSLQLLQFGQWCRGGAGEVLPGRCQPRGTAAWYAGPPWLGYTAGTLAAAAGTLAAGHAGRTLAAGPDRRVVRDGSR